ncbi:MAG: cytidylyltransferase domain-containing protein [Verrucomicrobiaceae bacterium]
MPRMLSASLKPAVTPPPPEPHPVCERRAGRVFAFIFVRGGSKGVPGKNLRRVGGRSLLARAIDVALACPRIEKVIVSTDDEALAAEARAYGALVPFVRPEHLAQDDSPELLAWKHAVCAVREDATLGAFEFFLSLPATSPLRSVEDVNACLDVIIQSDADLVITVTAAHRHPSFNMVKLNDEGLASVYLPPGTEIAQRQSAPVAWDMATVAYAARADWLLKSRGLWDGKVRAVVVPTERAIDIDTELDLEMAEFFNQRQPPVA